MLKTLPSTAHHVQIAEAKIWLVKVPEDSGIGRRIEELVVREGALLLVHETLRSQRHLTHHPLHHGVHVHGHLVVAHACTEPRGHLRHHHVGHHHVGTSHQRGELAHASGEH
jgi:hypothetical protein